MNKKLLQLIIVSLILIALSVVVAVYAISTGSVDISFKQIFAALMGTEDNIQANIIMQIRMPRIILGFVVGGSLSLAGAILQGIFKNPLVEPYTLGISGGAALGVATTIVFALHQLWGAFVLPLSGFIGAVLIMILVYMLSLRQGKLRVQNMLLTGVMISFIASSAMMFLMSISSSENLHSIIFWIMGSLDEPDMGLIRIAIWVSLIGLGVSYMFVQSLNALRLGEEKARYLGINTDVAIRILFVVASLLTGLCVSVAGVIGFVGLIVPHLMRIFTGSYYRLLLLSSFLGGGIFLVLSDTIARTIIAPNELPIGVITGIVGGALFVVILSRSRRKKIEF